jgi:hypothetical protein
MFERLFKDRGLRPIRFAQHLPVRGTERVWVGHTRGGLTLRMEALRGRA